MFNQRQEIKLRRLEWPEAAHQSVRKMLYLMSPTIVNHCHLNVPSCTQGHLKSLDYTLCHPMSQINCQVRLKLNI